MKVSKLLTAAGCMIQFLHLFILPDAVFSNTPETQAGFETQSATKPDTTGKYRLVQMARERGWVRIIVTWKMEGHQREGLLGQGQRHAQREDIQQLQQQRIEELEAKGLNITIQRNMQLNPRTAMAVDKEALIYLYNSDKVSRIGENFSLRRQTSDSTEIIKSDYVNSHFALTGEESVVVIIDDGVERFHEAFGWPSSPSRFIDGACFSTNLTVPDPNNPNNTIIITESLCPDGNDSELGVSAGVPCEDDDIECDHGTFVAGIAVGENGVAPGASIVSINALSKSYDPDTCGQGNTPCEDF